MRFGRRAQEEILTKEEAYEAASAYPGTVYLSEHGGTGEGVIGALAGAGLRLTGSDGRIKGKIKPENGPVKLTVEELCRKYPVDRIVSEDGEILPDDTVLYFAEASKAVYMDRLVTLVAVKKDGVWMPRPHKGNKK